MARLIFIDTNIFLDFYRVTGRQEGLSILGHIDDHHERIITTTQVEMEFKKNRPGVILSAHRSLKTPDWSGLKLPAYLSESKQSSGLDTGRKDIERQLRTLRTRIKNVLKRPGRYDPVFKVAQRLFRATGENHLTRQMKERRSVRRRAFRRFMLGYPPRKPDDTSVGDAFNWEWIVDCACRTSDDVVVVSRDSDYGVSFDGSVIINDWLMHEFKERVGRRRTVRLTDRLTEGLKLADIRVSKSEERAEDALLKQIRTAQAALGAHSGANPVAAAMTGNFNRILSTWVTKGPAIEDPVETGV